VIYLNDKISNNVYPNSLIVNSKPTNNTSYLSNSDYVTFSGDSAKDKKTQDKNKLIAYILGGAAIVAGIIIAVKMKHGKTPSGESGKGIIEGAKDSSKKSSGNISENGAKNLKHSGSSSNPSGTSVQNDERLSNLDKEKEALQNRVNDLGKQVKSQEAVREEEAKLIDRMIEIFQPKDKETAREVLPFLNKHHEKLGIELKDYNKYLDNITPKNKDFIINEGIPLITGNIEQIKQVVKDPENLHRLFSSLNSENKDAFKVLLDKSKVLKIKNTFTLSEMLENINAQNISLISNEVIPAIEKNPNDFKWLDDFLLGDFIKGFNKNNKDELLKDIIPNVVKRFDKSKIKYDGTDVLNALKVINPDNKKFVFDELLPHLVENAIQYNIKNGDGLVSYLKVITPKNKDFIFQEILPLLNQYSSKLKISRADEMAETLKFITPENKDNIKLIADNSEKLGFGVNNDNISTFEKLLKRDKQEILSETKKS
jgi:hypothetical protein